MPTGTSFGRKRSGVLHGVYFVKGKALQITKIKKVKKYFLVLNGVLPYGHAS